MADDDREVDHTKVPKYTRQIGRFFEELKNNNPGEHPEIEEALRQLAQQELPDMVSRRDDDDPIEEEEDPEESSGNPNDESGFNKGP